MALGRKPGPIGSDDNRVAFITGPGRPGTDVPIPGPTGAPSWQRAIAEARLNPVLQSQSPRAGVDDQAVPTGAEDPAITVCLPREGPGFKSYKTQETQYGHGQTVEFIKKLGAAWAERYPKGPLLLIGDLSVKGGGQTPRQWGNPSKGYHKSHGSGLDFDVQIIRTDGVEKARSIQISDKLYDQKRTQELVDLIHEQAGKDLVFILSADKELTGKGMKLDASHTRHLHVRLRG